MVTAATENELCPQALWMVPCDLAASRVLDCQRGAETQATADRDEVEPMHSLVVSVTDGVLALWILDEMVLESPSSPVA